MSNQVAWDATGSATAMAAVRYLGALGRACCTHNNWIHSDIRLRAFHQSSSQGWRNTVNRYVRDAFSLRLVIAFVYGGRTGGKMGTA